MDPFQYHEKEFFVSLSTFLEFKQKYCQTLKHIMIKVIKCRVRK